jgi:hypothetical protein
MQSQAVTQSQPFRNPELKAIMLTTTCHVFYYTKPHSTTRKGGGAELIRSAGPEREARGLGPGSSAASEREARGRVRQPPSAKREACVRQLPSAQREARVRERSANDLGPAPIRPQRPSALPSALISL